MTFRLLGPLDVQWGESSVPLGPPQQRAVLAALLLRAGTPVSVDTLVDSVWPYAAPRSAVNLVQGYVARLRKALDLPVLLTRAPGYVLDVRPERIDARRFERLIERATRVRATEPAAAAALLNEALGLWRGEPLADLPDRPFAEAERMRLDQLRRVALDEQVDAGFALGRHTELVAALHARVAAEPLRERSCAQLMTALYRTGRPAEALVVYERTRRTLAEELGADPGPELQGLTAAILRHDPAVSSGGTGCRHRTRSPAAVRARASRRHAR